VDRLLATEEEVDSEVEIALRSVKPLLRLGQEIDRRVMSGSSFEGRLSLSLEDRLLRLGLRLLFRRGRAGIRNAMRVIVSGAAAVAAADEEERWIKEGFRGRAKQVLLVVVVVGGETVRFRVSPGLVIPTHSAGWEEKYY